MARPELRVRIGFVRRAHGVRGELEVKTFDPGSRTLREGTEVFLPGDEGSASARRVLAVRPGREGILLTVEGVGDRDAAEALRGRPVEVSRDALPRAAPGEHYLVDLIGFTVETAGGSVVGELTGGGGPQPLLEVTAGRRTILVPAVPEILVKIDRRRRVVVIDPPDGLLDLDLA